MPSSPADPPNPSELAERLTRSIPANHPFLSLVRADLEQRIAESTQHARSGTSSATPLPPDLTDPGSPPLQRPWWTRRGPLLLLAVAALLLFAAPAIPLIHPYFPKWDFRHTRSSLSIFEGTVDPDAPLDPGAEDKYGYEESLDFPSLQRLERSYRAHPTPAGYEAYAWSSLREGRLPPDFDSESARIDPGNGIWPFLKALEPSIQSTCTARWFEFDSPAPETLAFLRQAVAAPRFHSHTAEFLAHCRASIHPASYRSADLLEWKFSSWLRSEDATPLGNLSYGGESSGASETQIHDDLKVLGPLLGRQVLDGLRPSPRTYLYHVHSPGFSTEIARIDELDRILSAEPAREDSDREDESSLYRLARIAGNVRQGLLATSLATLVGAVALGLRLLLRPPLPALAEKPLLPLIRPVRILLWAAVSLTAILPLSIWVHGVLRPADLVERPGSISLSALPVAVPLFTGLVVHARRQASRHTRFAGLGLSRRQIRTGQVMLTLSLCGLALWCLSWEMPIFRIAGLILWLAPAGWWIFRLCLGYCDYRRHLRHCLIARQIIPVLLILTAALGLSGLALPPIEAHLVDQAFHLPQPPADDLSPATRQQVENWIAAWPK